MRLSIGYVGLSSSTREGVFGRAVSFSEGLNIVRAANSRGKTQVVQAIIYAFGMERMLSARANAPLGSALTSELITGPPGGERKLAVEQSFVVVEIKNQQGRIATIRRYVKHPTIRPDLVEVWESRVGEINEESISLDYFLHSAGSASRERGFHFWLAKFVGWDLPEVSTLTGNMTMLYLDVLFPFMLVDQQSWGSAAPRRVSRYQIRDPLRRAVEFLLMMDGPEAEAQRVALEKEMTELRADWSSARSALEAAAGALGARLAGVPESPSGAVNRAGTAQATNLDSAVVEVLHHNEWLPIEDVLGRTRTALAEAAEREVPSLRPEADPDAVERLRSAKRELNDLLLTARLMDEESTVNEARLAALENRLQSLGEERSRNADLRSLARLGSQVAAVHIASHSCPTCTQSLDNVELHNLGQHADVEQTITLLDAQMSTAQKMRDRARLVLAQNVSAFSAIQGEVDRTRTLVRALESDLTAPVGMSNTGHVAERVSLEMRVNELGRLSDIFEERKENLSDIARRIAEVRNSIKALPSQVPQRDVELVERVTELMRRNLRLSEFASYSSQEVQLDPDSLRPSRENFDIDVDVSASDVVRLKVAYLEAVRLLGSQGGRHLGLLVLDEPRQQDIERSAFSAMLNYLADGAFKVGQVIVTSATELAEINAMVDARRCRVVDLGEERLLQPVRSDGANKSAP